MKKTASIRVYSTKVFITLLFASLFLSCTDDAEEASPKTLTDVITEKPNFTLLETALHHAGLSDALKTGYMTLFAPNDSAFVAAGFSNEAALTAVPAADLKKILEYHLLTSVVKAEEVVKGPNKVVSAFSKDSIYIGRNDSGMFVNGALVKQTDIRTANGIIHSVDHLLTPPKNSLLELAQSNSDLTFLSTAINRVGVVNPQIAAALSARTGNYTIFAPSNQAFINAGYTTIDKIQNANIPALTNLLLYHVISVRLFTNNIINGKIVPMAAGKTIDVVVGTTISLTGTGNNGLPAKITKSNQLASNGVIHVIDRLLLP